MRGRGGLTTTNTATFTNHRTTTNRSTPFNKTYQSFGTTPMSVTSNFYESSRPLNFQSVKYNMPIQLKGNMIKWSKDTQPATWNNLISKTTGVFKPPRGDVMFSKNREKQSYQSKRTLQPHLQEAPKIPFRKPPISPKQNKKAAAGLFKEPAYINNKENFNLIVPPDPVALANKITGCSRSHNDKVYKSDVKYRYTYDQTNAAVNSHKPMRRQSCKPAMEKSSQQQYIGNAADGLLKDSSVGMRASTSFMLKNIRDYRSSIAGLPGSQTRPLQDTISKRSGSRVNRNLQTTYQKLNQGYALPQRAKSARTYPKTSTQNRDRDSLHIPAKRQFKINQENKHNNTKKTQELKIQTRGSRPEGIQNMFKSSISFN